MQFSPVSSLEVTGTLLITLTNVVGLSLFTVMIMFGVTTVTYSVVLPTGWQLLCCRVRLHSSLSDELDPVHQQHVKHESSAIITQPTNALIVCHLF